MKNYLAFYGSVYYPRGGMADFVGDYDTLDEAIASIHEANKKNNPEDSMWDFCWGNIWSCKDRMEVYCK